MVVVDPHPHTHISTAHSRLDRRRCSWSRALWTALDNEIPNLDPNFKKLSEFCQLCQTLTNAFPHTNFFFSFTYVLDVCELLGVNIPSLSGCGCTPHRATSEKLTFWYFGEPAFSRKRMNTLSGQQPKLSKTICSQMFTIITVLSYLKQYVHKPNTPHTHTHQILFYAAESTRSIRVGKIRRISTHPERSIRSEVHS